VHLHANSAGSTANDLCNLVGCELLVNGEFHDFSVASVQAAQNLPHVQISFLEDVLLYEAGPEPLGQPGVRCVPSAVGRQNLFRDAVQP
jgi:hypothetical protein